MHWWGDGGEGLRKFGIGENPSVSGLFHFWASGVLAILVRTTLFHRNKL